MAPYRDYIRFVDDAKACLKGAYTNGSSDFEGLARRPNWSEAADRRPQTLLGGSCVVRSGVMSKVAISKPIEGDIALGFRV